MWEVAAELSRRLTRIFLRDGDGRRAVFGNVTTFQRDALWRDLVPFHEYFNGDTGAGIGASHQTGWTGLVVKLLQQSGEGELDEDERQVRMEPAAAGTDEAPARETILV